MNSDLVNKKCIPCEGGTPPLSEDKVQELLIKVQNWKIQDGKLQREFHFKNFKESMKFVNSIASIAEVEQHHPDIYIFYSLVKITLWTHAIGGLSENDFIMAAKINSLH